MNTNLRYGIALTTVVLALSAAPQATTCAAPNNIPAGTYVTPDCTYIVAQTDPGEWLDNLFQRWILVLGRPFKTLSVAWLAGGR